MVNAFAHAVKAVSASDVVIIGGLAPYGIQKKGEPIDKVGRVDKHVHWPKNRPVEPLYETKCREAEENDRLAGKDLGNSTGRSSAA